MRCRGADPGLKGEGSRCVGDAIRGRGRGSGRGGFGVRTRAGG